MFPKLGFSAFVFPHLDWVWDTQKALQQIQKQGAFERASKGVYELGLDEYTSTRVQTKFQIFIKLKINSNLYE